MKTSDRIRNLRVNNSMTQKDLSNKINTSVVTVQCWENGSKRPSMEAIISLSKTFNVSADYILGLDQSCEKEPNFTISSREKHLIETYRQLDSHGKKLVRTIMSIEKSRIKESNINLNSCMGQEQYPVRYIPKYLTPSAAGLSVSLDTDNFEMIVVDETTPSDSDFAVIIRGDSMNPFIKDGDTVFVKSTIELQNGEIGIICVDDEMYCKHFYRDNNGNTYLVSANEKLKETNIFIPNDDCGHSIRICGKVILNEKIFMPNYFSAP